MIATVERVVQTRETNVEECKEEIGDVHTQMEGTLKNLKTLMKSQDERIEKMESSVDSLNHKNDHIVNGIKIEIQNAKDDRDDAQDKSINLEKVAAIAAALLTGIAQLLSSLQSIGLLR